MPQPVVTISTGKLRGSVGKSTNDRKFHSFQGIPYGKPPIGELRFKAPLPAEPWDGIKDATQEGNDCFFRHSILKTFVGSEDCLTLNVYTSCVQTVNKPVMVWIHGGGFTSGSGSTELYGPEFLLNEDIVLVTINYRTGILGFLSLKDETLQVPGNAGLKDMILGLKWVQQNISSFGGNAKNVTIFGESAGAAGVHYIVLSPLGKNLFHKAILQSGCALNLWASGRKCSKDLSEALGLPSFDEKLVLEKLRSLPVEKLYEISEKLRDVFIADSVRPYAPVIERKSPDAFICEHPRNILKSGKYNHVPIIIGFTSREGMITEAIQKPKPFRPHSNFEKTIPYFVNIKPNSDVSKLVATQIKEFYYGEETPSAQNKDKFYLLESDNFIVREILETVRLHLETSSSPIFFYRMSVETGLNLMKNVYGLTEPGVCHADDLGYLFKSVLTPEVVFGSPEKVGMTRFVKLWTNFAKCGNPNKNWRPVTKQQFYYLDIGPELTPGTSPKELGRMTFWKDIFKAYFINKL